MRRVIGIVAAITAVACTVSANERIHQEHSFEVRPKASLVVEVSFHDVEVTARPGSTVDVVVDIEVRGSSSRAQKAADDLEPQFIDEGGRFVVRSTSSTGWSRKSLSAKGTVAIRMPPGMDLSIVSSSGGARIVGDLGDAAVRFDASSGSLSVDGSMRELHSEVSSGSVRAQLGRPVEIFTAEASSGSVRMNGGAGRARVDTSSGEITLGGLLGDAHLEASSGSISAVWTAIQPGAIVRAGASSGSVILRFPAGATLRGVVDVSSGSIHSDFPGSVSKNHLSLRGGPEAVDVQVETSSGSVKLLKN